MNELKSWACSIGDYDRIWDNGGYLHVEDYGSSAHGMPRYTTGSFDLAYTKNYRTMYCAPCIGWTEPSSHMQMRLMWYLVMQKAFCLE